MNAKGPVFKYGDNIDTDVIIAARYLNTSDPKELAKHCLQDLDPTFVERVKPGDIMTIRFGDHLGRYEILAVPGTVRKEGAAEIYRVLEEDAAMASERGAEE